MFLKSDVIADYYGNLFTFCFRKVSRSVGGIGAQLCPFWYTGRAVGMKRRTSVNQFSEQLIKSKNIFLILRKRNNVFKRQIPKTFFQPVKHAYFFAVLQVCHG